MEDREKRFQDKRWVPLLLIALLLALIGITLGWFTYFNRLNTISVVQIPSRITISGANRSEMQKISLEMTSDDTQEGNRVTIRRVFCIESTDDFLLEVAHTTNIPNMEIKIFPVSNENSDLKNVESGAVKGTDLEKVFYYNPDQGEIIGEYLNSNGSIAIQGSNSGSLHGKTYLDSENNVQQNAEPLYWLTKTTEKFDLADYSREGKAGDGVTDICYRYYVLQLSWDIDEAETDMVYLLASHKE